MSLPVTPEDFTLIGSRYASEDIVAEIDRFLPLATTDLPLLKKRGYGLKQLTELKSFHGELTARVAAHRRQNGTKKSSRKVEAEAIRDGKLVLRSGVTLATAALSARTPADGETPEQTRTIVGTIVEQLDALGGRIGVDSVKLRTRLVGLKTVLALPEIAPTDADDAKERAEFVAKIDAALAALPELATQKKADQQDTRTSSMELDELEGRAYTNLKLLAQVGRAYWNEHRNPARAAEYQLNKLNEPRGRDDKAAPAPITPAPITPAPAPAPGG